MTDIVIPEHQLYQITDYFTSIDELLREAVIPLLQDIDSKITNISIPEEYLNVLANAIASAIQSLTVNVESPNISVSQAPNLISLLIEGKLRPVIIDRRNVSLTPNRMEVLYSSNSDKVVVPFMMINVNSKDVEIIRKIGDAELTDTIDDIYSTVMNINDNDLYVAMYDDTNSVYTVVLSPQATPLLSNGGLEVKIRNVSSGTINIVREKIIAYEVVE